MSLKQLHITQDYKALFPEAAKTLDPDGDSWIELNKIAQLDLREQAYLFTDLYRQVDYASLDFNYWKTFTGLKEGGMEKIGNTLWAFDPLTAAQMKAPRNQRAIQLQFSIVVDPPHPQNEKIGYILQIALESLSGLGPPPGRPDPFAKQIFPFVPQFESVPVMFTTQEIAAQLLPSSHRKEFLNGTFDAFSIAFPAEEGPMFVVFLIGDRLLTPDSNQPGRLMAKLTTILAHEIYGNIATLLTDQKTTRQQKEIIAFQTGIDFVTKMLQRFPNFPEHLKKELEKQREMEKVGLEFWKNATP